MVLKDGTKGNTYEVNDLQLPLDTKRRLEALGMIRGTKVHILNMKNHGTLIIKIRGTRFAIGKAISANIHVKEN